MRRWKLLVEVNYVGGLRLGACVGGFKVDFEIGSGFEVKILRL